jgi:hypothetical protein
MNVYQIINTVWGALASPLSPEGTLWIISLTPTPIFQVKKLQSNHPESHWPSPVQDHEVLIARLLSPTDILLRERSLHSWDPDKHSMACLTRRSQGSLTMALSEENASQVIHTHGQLPLGLRETWKINDEDGLGGSAPRTRD